MTEHSKLPPSSSARRMACPGSREMTERYGRNEESEASKEGMLAHELAAHNLLDKVSKDNLMAYTDEMWEGAKLFNSIVVSFCQNMKSTICMIETKIDISNVNPDMWGTPDAVLINLGENGIPKEIHVFDYKFGFTPVDSFENWQLIAYACGIIRTNPQATDIYLHIVQPRDYISSSKHKVWKLTSDELESYRKRLQISEALSMSPNAELRVSNECKYCPARHACPALQQAAFGATEIAFKNTSNELSPEQIGNELKLLHDAREVLEYRITALETEAQYHLQAGKQVNHFELKPVEGRMNWNVDKGKIIEVGLLHGVDLRKEDVITPTQAIKAGVPEPEVVKYSERKQSLKLSKIDFNHTKRLFKQQ